MYFCMQQVSATGQSLGDGAWEQHSMVISGTEQPGECLTAKPFSTRSTPRDLQSFCSLVRLLSLHHTLTLWHMSLNGAPTVCKTDD